MHTITGQVLWTINGPESSETISDIARNALVNEFGGEGWNFEIDVDGDEDGTTITFSFESTLSERALDARIWDMDAPEGEGQYGRIVLDFNDVEIN